VEVIDDVAFVTKLAGYEYTKFFDYSIGGEIIALRALNIKNEEIVLDNVQTIPRKTSDLLPRSKISKGDILLTYIGAYIGDVLLIKESNKYHLAPNIAKITSDKKMSSEYMEILLRSYLVQSQMQNLVVTTATPSLTMGQIRKIKLVYPIDPLEQKKIVDTFVSLKNKIRIEQMNLQKIRSLKTGLMQDLLSGRVRVNM
jgi:type I restriction enzyme S subunit